MEITLSEDQQVVIISDPFAELSEVTLVVGDVIDFVEASGPKRAYSGMIQKFQVVKDAFVLGADSVWMLMKETTRKGEDQSISILNWKGHVDAGAIKY